MEKNNITQVICKNCGGELNIDPNSETAVCPYCGSSYDVSDTVGGSDAVKIEKIKSEAYKAAENARFNHEKEQNKIFAENAELMRFRKGKLSKVLIIFSVICLLTGVLGIQNDHIMAALVSFAQTALFIVSWLMGMQIIKVKIHRLHSALALVGFLMIIPFFVTMNSGGSRDSEYKKEYEKTKWSSLTLAQYLPDPPNDMMDVILDSEDSLSVDIDNVSRESYKSYIEACKEKGYNLESSLLTGSYTAQNADGYKLRLYYYSDKKELDINLDIPKNEDPQAGTAENGETQNAPENSAESTQPDTQAEAPASSGTGVDPQLKATLDSYEKFIDEYISFAKKYKDSNQPVSMLADYTKIMTQYADWATKLSEIKSENLSPADLGYYMEVTARCAQKISTSGI